MLLTFSAACSLKWSDNARAELISFKNCCCGRARTTLPEAVLIKKSARVARGKMQMGRLRRLSRRSNKHPSRIPRRVVPRRPCEPANFAHLEPLAVLPRVKVVNYQTTVSHVYAVALFPLQSDTTL